MFNNWNEKLIVFQGFNAVSQYEGQSVSALGWGFSENDSLFNKECGLRIVDLTLFKQSECPTDVSTLLCAGYKESSRGTCGVFLNIHIFSYT